MASEYIGKNHLGYWSMVVFLVLLLLLAGVRAYDLIQDRVTESRLGQIKIGMSEAQVINLAGVPSCHGKGPSKELVYETRVKASCGSGYINFRMLRTSVVLGADGTVSEVKRSYDRVHVDFFEALPIHERLWWLFRY